MGALVEKNVNKRTNGNTIHIKRISIDSEHIRRSTADITALKDTISDAGLLQPILVRQTERGYTVIDGARRLQALRELDVPELIIGRDVIVDVEETDADFTFKQLIANVQREDINDIELGYAFVTLKEKYGYAYRDVAAIIGKTPHYVAAKVGLAKRLTPEVQELVIKDWEEAKCIRNTRKCDSDDVLDPYAMNVNVLEDIARLPAELQKASYEVVREKEMDKKEALRYLKVVKQEAELLKIADDTKGLMDQYSRENQIISERDFHRYIKKIDKDLENLSVTIRAGTIKTDEVMPALEALIERLNAICAEIKGQKDAERVSV